MVGGWWRRREVVECPLKRRCVECERRKMVILASGFSYIMMTGFSRGSCFDFDFDIFRCWCFRTTLSPTPSFSLSDHYSVSI